MLVGQVAQHRSVHHSDASRRTFVHSFKALALTVCVGLIAGCAGTSGGNAPVNDLSSASTSSSSPSIPSYTVKPGDTLVKISRSTGVDENTIKRLNNLSNPNMIRVGQVLRMSDKADSTIAGAAPIVSSSRPEARPLDQSAGSGSAPADANPARAADAGVINWGWPAKGKVIQGFTAGTKGIDIAGNPGDAIEAAANGKVMYAGNGVRGLGNLVIVNHDNGFITAYAHNKTLLVKTGQDVKKGAKIAEMGQTDTTSPRLHFEVRRQGTPVDPLQYLPAK